MDKIGSTILQETLLASGVINQSNEREDPLLGGGILGWLRRYQPNSPQIPILEESAREEVKQSKKSKSRKPKQRPYQEQIRLNNEEDKEEEKKLIYSYQQPSDYIQQSIQEPVIQQIDYPYYEAPDIEQQEQHIIQEIVQQQEPIIEQILEQQQEPLIQQLEQQLQQPRIAQREQLLEQQLQQLIQQPEQEQAGILAQISYLIGLQSVQQLPDKFKLLAFISSNAISLIKYLYDRREKAKLSVIQNETKTMTNEQFIDYVNHSTIHEKCEWKISNDPAGNATGMIVCSFEEGTKIYNIR